MRHQQKSILIIDDDSLIRERLKYDLKAIDSIHLIEASSLEEAKSCSCNHDFDLMIVDLNLPDGSGKDFIQYIQGCPRCKDIPTIVLSADGSDDAVIECLNQGANDYLVKPWKKEVLLARVNSQITRSLNLKALMQSQQELDTVLTEQSELVCRFTPDLKLIYANRSFIDFYQHNQRHLNDYPLLEAIPQTLHKKVMQQLESLSQLSPVATHEYQSIKHERTMVWQQWTIRASFDADQVMAYQLVISDITELKTAEFKLRRAQRLLSEAQCVANLAGWEYDIKTHAFEWTDQITNLLETESAPPTSLNEFALMIPDPDCNQFRRAIEHASQEGSAFDTEIRFTLKNNREIWVRAIGQPELMDLDVVTIWGAFQDITEKKLTEIQRETMRERLEYEATHDQLTELYNRRFIFEQMEKQFASAQRYQQPLCLCLCDIDHFKSVNDQWGHITGDRALRHIANILKSSVRGSDFVGRYGGEEFAILFPMTPLNGAAICIRRALESIRRSPLNSDQNDAIPLTATFGLAQYDPSLDNGLDQFINRVDAALYQGKNDGRDRYILSPSKTRTQI